MPLSSTSAKPLLRAAAWLPAALWYRVIWGFSAQTSAVSGGLSDNLLWRLLAVLAPSFASADVQTQSAAVELLSFFERKAAHMFLYFILTLLIWFALAPILRKKPARAVLSALLCALLAGLDEYHQTFVPGRSGQLRDVLVDLGGGLLALGLLALLALTVRCQKKPRLRPAALVPIGLGVLLALLPAAASPQRLAALPAFSWAAARFVADFPALSPPAQAALAASLAPILRETLFLAACGPLGCLAALTAALAGLRPLSSLGASLLSAAAWAGILSLLALPSTAPAAVALALLGALLGAAVWLAAPVAGRIR